MPVIATLTIHCCVPSKVCQQLPGFKGRPPLLASMVRAARSNLFDVVLSRVISSASPAGLGLGFGTSFTSSSVGPPCSVRCLRHVPPLFLVLKLYSLARVKSDREPPVGPPPGRWRLSTLGLDPEESSVTVGTRVDGAEGRRRG